MKAIEWYNQGLLPGLLYFQNGGKYCGSVNDFNNKATREFRYKIEPNKDSIKVMVWYGPYCYEKSDMADQAEFTLDGSGHTKIFEWLKVKYESMIE